MMRSLASACSSPIISLDAITMPQPSDPIRPPSQSPPSGRAELIAYLAEGPRSRVETWLDAALHGKIPLPDHRSEESPYLTILRIEPDLSSTARRDLDAACHRLVIELCEAADPEAVCAAELLALTAELGIVKAATPLGAAAATFPDRPNLSHAFKRSVVGALLDLRVPQPPALWSTLLERAPSLAGGAFAGLLRSSPSDALMALPNLPNRSPLADAVTLTIEQHVADMTREEREFFVPRLRVLLLRCAPNLRATLDLWLEQAGYASMTSAASGAARPVPSWRQNLASLTSALTQRNPDYQPAPISPRL